jgi:hypothetical protein
VLGKIVCSAVCLYTYNGLWTNINDHHNELVFLSILNHCHLFTYCDVISLIAAEESVLSRGGSVVRLAGLYTLDRGPHTFWLNNGTCASNADGLVNTLHYEDAARVAIAACLYGEDHCLYYCLCADHLFILSQIVFLIISL